MSIIARKHKVLIGQAKAMFRDILENFELCEDEEMLNRYRESPEYLKTINIIEEVVPAWLEGNEDTPSLDERIETRRKELNDGYYG